MRAIAFYLPQYYPIPENDAMWGAGFTEWTNVRGAKALFRGHYQPRIPANLGYYDLRSAETRNAQAELARKYGIEAFCYWHYWLGGGKRLLEIPFSAALLSGKPDFPFCLSWANQSWTGVWYGRPDQIIVEQKYGGAEDYRAHFYALLPAFRDKRYLKVDGKNLFLVYRPHEIPDLRMFSDLWRQCAAKEKIDEFFFVGEGEEFDLQRAGFDAQIEAGPMAQMNCLGGDNVSRLIARKKSLRERILRVPYIFDYSDIVRANNNRELAANEYPVVLPNWDNTPRCGADGLVWRNSTPELFNEMCRKAAKQISNRAREHQMIFIKSWNEWAEGNYLEPDERFGLGHLEALRGALGS